MKSPFKEGDRVRCMDDSCQSNRLKVGNIYTVAEVHEQGGFNCQGQFLLKEINDGFTPNISRFRLAKPTNAEVVAAARKKREET